ncbi:MAG: hypothetical protein CM1200mP41_38290 [Gammaproteobacteria bacterium]|nr:MAG: hypothetical protein CM1200mP41_38290 [Gammaproteobacteria bacterium]
MRYLSMDGFNAVYQSSALVDQAEGTEYHARFPQYLHQSQDADLTVGIAMTDAKGDRSLRPHQQSNPDSYLRVIERRADGIVISGTKAIVTAAPYVHHLLVLPGRNMVKEDQIFPWLVRYRLTRRGSLLWPDRPADPVRVGHFSGSLRSDDWPMSL